MNIPISPKARALVTRFLVSNTQFDEMPLPVNERWASLLQHFPQLRDRHLFDDFSDIYRNAAERGDFGDVTMALNLAWLQNRFIHALYHHGMLPTHIHQILIEHGYAWQKHLLARQQVTTMPQRSDGRIRKAKIPPYKTPTWVQ